jgi:radical SAM-linked protein
MRLRITYSKQADMRYTGNLDMQRMWERLLRRAKLPVAYSQGFHPQARINQACALPLGFTSRCEIVDIWLNAEINPAEAGEAVQRSAPPGLKVLEVRPIDHPEPALQTQVLAADYDVTLLDLVDGERLRTAIDSLMSETSVLRIRREKTYDLRPLIESLSIDTQPEKGDIHLQMRLSARESATGRPEEVLAVLGISPQSAAIERTGLYLRAG